MTSEEDEGANGVSLRCKMEEHFDDFREWVETTRAIQVHVANMSNETRNLSSLPAVLHDVVYELRMLRESLVIPATAMPKWSMPLAAVLPVIAGMAFCVVILGAVIVLGVAGDGSTKITPHGIEITRPDVK